MEETTVTVTCDGEVIYEKAYEHKLCPVERKGVKAWLKKKFEGDITIEFIDKEGRCKHTAELF